MSDCKAIWPNSRVCEKGTKGCGVTHDVEAATIHEIKLPHDIAEMICQMEEVCHGEGMGPDNEKLMSWIQETYPDLREKFAYLYWPEEA